MIKIKNSEIESIIDYYIIYYKLGYLYLNFDYKNNKAYVSEAPLTDTIVCLNDIIDGDNFNIFTKRYVFEKLIDIIFENKRKKQNE